MQLFLGNVPHEATVENIREFCSEYGELHNLHVPPPKMAGSKNAGYAFAMYKTRIAAAEAMEALAGKSMTIGSHTRPLVRYRALSLLQRALRRASTCCTPGKKRRPLLLSV